MSADGMDLSTYRTVRTFIDGLNQMAEAHPHPNGRTVRVVLEDAEAGTFLGNVDTDITNLWLLGDFARSEAERPPVTPKRPEFRLLQGDKPDPGTEAAQR